MKERIRLVLAQINLWVGDVDGNAELIVRAAHRARDELGADMAIFPELALLGYPPDDLLLRSGMPPRVRAGLERIRDEVQGIGVVVGYPEYTPDGIYNAVAVFRDGQRIAGYRKEELPNYGVFDEKRHFRPGDAPCVFDLDGLPVGVTICEDIWEALPAKRARSAGARLLVNVNASPFTIGKSAEREEQLRARAGETGLPIVYVNSVGGQDELVFDGDSLVYDPDRGVIFRAPLFEEELYAVDFDRNGRLLGTPPIEPVPPDVEVIYRALVQAVRDYVNRNGFPGALVGLSGGIDSAMTLAIAADALGADRVRAVSMPSRYTADISKSDAREEAERLGVRFDEVVIEPLFNAYLETLQPLFEGREPDLTEENVQSRVRGTLLMALSNKFGHLVLATGNKSEMAVGYATLYGDMAGGFAPLKDIYKTWVYRLANYRNGIGAVIPQRVITRPPSAELRADQVDTDSLPDYAVLDAIVEAYVEDSRSIAEICDMGYPEAVVRQIAGLVRRAEYKRRQAPPGPKITRRAFGRDRRYPITAVYGDV